MADARVALRADDLYMAECQTCGLRFDERTYQVIVSGLGSFDSVDCAKQALRRRARRSGGVEALVRPVSQLEPQVVPPPPPALAENEDGPA